MFIFGGRGLDNKLHNDIWSFNPSNHLWEEISFHSSSSSSTPSPRYGMGCDEV